jgi:hypothetical protein
MKDLWSNCCLASAQAYPAGIGAHVGESGDITAARRAATFWW